MRGLDFCGGGRKTTLAEGGKRMPGLLIFLDFWIFDYTNPENPRQHWENGPSLLSKLLSKNPRELWIFAARGARLVVLHPHKRKANLIHAREPYKL